MHISERALRNRKFTIIALTALVANGLLGMWSMPRQEDPFIEMNECSVIVTFPGSSADKLEDLVLEPLEDRLLGLEEVESVQGWALDGAVYCVPVYADDASLDDAVDAIRSALKEAESDFPPGVTNTEVIRHKTGRVVVFQIAITGADYSAIQLNDYAELIEDELELISEIDEVVIEGAQTEEIRVSLDIDRLSEYGLSAVDIAARIKAGNISIPAGKVEVTGKKFNVTVEGGFESVEDVKNSVVHITGGMPVKISDIAEVEYTLADSIYWVRHNGRPAVFVTATQKEGTNLLKIGHKARLALQEITAGFPGDLDVEIVFDQADNVSRRLHTLFFNLLYGGALVAVVVFALVGGRLALVIICAIPLSIIIGIGGVYRYGLNFEQISISALILAIGMLVDNAIVIAENIQRHLDMGLSRFKSAVAGTMEVSGAVASATATTIAAFFPMMAMSGASGSFIRSMPLTVIFTLIASLIVALTATPLISLAVLRPMTGGGEHKMARRLRHFGDTRYPVILKAALRRPGLVILVTFAALIGSMALFTQLGKEFFPKADKTLFKIDVYLPLGSSYSTTDSLLKVIESDIIKEKDVEHVLTNIGKGNPTLFYNMGRGREKDYYGQLMVIMDSDTPYDDMFVLVEQLREKWSDNPAARIEVHEFTQGPPVGAPVAVRISGPDLGELRNLTERVELILRDTPGAIHVDNELKGSGGEIEIRIDRDRAGMLGIPHTVIARTVRMALAGEPVTSFRLAGEEREVVLRLPVEGSADYSDLAKIYVPNVRGMMFPLSEIAETVISGGPAQIAHKDRERSFLVRADADEGYFAADIAATVKPKLRNLRWPEGYSWNIEGETQERDESFESLFNAMIIGVLLIYAILVLQFKSFNQPFVIFTALPMAFIGAILGLWVTGNNFGFVAFIGLTSLVGIVINDAIVMLDFINQRIAAGSERDKAIVEAGKIRFVPILLTSITTIGGLLPLTVLSGKLWAPLGWAMIGGLVFSTVLTLIIVPVLFRVMVPVRKRDDVLGEGE